MSNATSAGSSRLLGFGEPSRARRLATAGAWIFGIAALIAVLGALGIDVVDWLETLWDTLTEISLQYLVAGRAPRASCTASTAIKIPLVTGTATSAPTIPKSAVNTSTVTTDRNGWISTVFLKTFGVMRLFSTCW